MENILEDIKELILKSTGKTKINLDRNTGLYRDLRIDGDDAFELLKEFSKQFGVDMSGFKFSEYFSPEGTDILGALVSLLGSKPKLKELTIGGLEIAVIERKLK